MCHSHDDATPLSFHLQVNKDFFKISGTQCGGFQLLLTVYQWGISLHAVVFFGLGNDIKNFKSSKLKEVGKYLFSLIVIKKL